MLVGAIHVSFHLRDNRGEYQHNIIGNSSPFLHDKCTRYRPIQFPIYLEQALSSERHPISWGQRN